MIRVCTRRLHDGSFSTSPYLRRNGLVTYISAGHISYIDTCHVHTCLQAWSLQDFSSVPTWSSPNSSPVVSYSTCMYMIQGHYGECRLCQRCSLKGSLPCLMRRPKQWALKCKRNCCSIVTSFPLAFVYGMTTWAIWVQVNLALIYKETTLRGKPPNFVPDHCLLTYS